MKYLYKFKYKIYKRFQSDIWGEIILLKKFNNLYKFILDNFEYNLRQFYKKYLINYLRHLKKLKRKRFKNFFFLKKFRKDLQLIHASTLVKKPIVEKKLGYFFLLSNDHKKLNLKILKYSYGLFWLNFLNIYANINLLSFAKIKYNRFFLLTGFQNKYRLRFKTIMFLTHLRRKLVGKNRDGHFKRFFLKKKPVFFKKRFNKFNIYDHLTADYMTPPRKFYFKERRSNWWNLKIEQDRTNVFFGFFTRKKFMKFQQNCFFANKIRAYWLLILVARLGFVLFQMNLYTNMYYIYNFIKSGNLLVNNKKITNPNYVISLFDNISFNKYDFKKIYLLLKFRFLNNQILINHPKYLEINYSTLNASLWRIPKGSDVIGPYDFPFKTFSYDWLLYKNYH